MKTGNRLALVAVLLASCAGSGCSGLVSRATEQFSSDLETAILNYTDPETVAQALPAYLLLLESRIESDPQDAALRLAVARLTAAYAGLFGEDAARARRLSSRALDHARQAVCVKEDALCDLASERDFERFDSLLRMVTLAQVDSAYVLATSWAGWIRAHADDYLALADLPRVETLLERLGELAPEYDRGGIWLYLGVLNSQRPPAAGGRPELAKTQFERADVIAGGRNLLIPLFMADSYARLMFDRDLFGSLLERVIRSETEEAGLTLMNLVAQQRARTLLAQQEEIFD